MLFHKSCKRCSGHFSSCFNKITITKLHGVRVTSIKGIKVGRMLSPNTLERTSNPAALHFLKFQTFTASSSSCSNHQYFFSKFKSMRWPRMAIAIKIKWLNKRENSKLTSSSPVSDPCNREAWKRGFKSCYTFSTSHYSKKLKHINVERLKAQLSQPIFAALAYYKRLALFFIML